MNSYEPKKRRIPRWPFTILVILVIIAGAGYYYYKKYIADNRWKPILQAKLKELILKSTDSLYHIEYSDFDLDIVSGNATLKNFKLIPDTVIYQKLVALKKAPDNLFILDVSKLSIKNIGARKAYQEKIMDIKNISIDRPTLTIISKRYAFNDTVKVGKPKAPYDIIKKIFRQLRVDSISLKDISVNYINKSHPVTKQTALKHLDINISDVLIDSLSAADPNRFYYTKGVDVIVHDYSINTPDSLYTAGIKKIFFSTSQRRIILDKVSFLPRYNKTDFYRKVGESTDRFTLKFSQIILSDIDLQSILRDQILYAGTMDIKRSNVEIYNNNAYKGHKTNKIGKDPHQALQNVALDLKLKKINIYNTDISYAEYDATSGATGVITFNNTTGYFLNVTNDDDAKKRNPYMVARIHTKFMNVAPLAVKFRFNLLAKDGAFNYAGSLGHFDGRVLDKLVKPLALVHIESADIDKLNFNVNASNYGGKGLVEFYYKNLNIQLLKKVDGKAELQKQGFVSKLANTLIIENSNPDKKGNFRPGPIDLKREPTTSFFSFLYKALLDGLKPSVGFTKKTENTVNKTVEKVSNILDKYNQYKENRRAKREARKKEKQEKKEQKEKEKLEEQEKKETPGQNQPVNNQ